MEGAEAPRLGDELDCSSQVLRPLFAQFPKAGVARARGRKARPREVSDWLRITQCLLGGTTTQSHTPHPPSGGLDPGQTHVPSFLVFTQEPVGKEV